MFSNISIFGFLNERSSFLSFVLGRDKALLSLNKLEKTIFKIFLYSFNTLILTKIILYLIPDALIVNYLGANPCWNNFGTSAFSGSIIQIPGLLLHPMACTLTKQGIMHAFIEVFIAAVIVAVTIALYFENKYSCQKKTKERDVLSFNEIRSVIGTRLTIKREQKDKENFVHIKDSILSEVLRIPESSQFCWMDIYGGNEYGPIFWEEKPKESEDQVDNVMRTEIELKP